MGKIRSFLAGTLAFLAALALPNASFSQLDTKSAGTESCFFHDTFENGSDGWEGRGGASVTTADTAYAGSKALTVSDRKSSWHGAMKALDADVFKAGVEYSASTKSSFQMQKSLSRETLTPTVTLHPLILSEQEGLCSVICQALMQV